GLTSSSCEMAARAGTGLEIDLTLVPQREQGMSAYEIMLSESQERMLIVAHRGRERQVVDIFRRWDLDAVVIGRVTDTGNVVVLHHGARLADIPSKLLTDEAPRYERPMRAPEKTVESPESGVRSRKAETETRTAATGKEVNNVLVDESAGGEVDNASIVNSDELDGILDAPSTVTGDSDSGLRTPDSGLDFNESLRRLLSATNVASKEWVYRQYDHMVRTNTAVLPGADAAVVRIKETRRALAMCLDGNGRYCAVEPREGAKHLVAEAARNVVCVGARPIAITNCLNFASPERPEVMWAFSEVIDGMAEACRAFGTPVVSGNVSFYNETEGRGIHPTPVIGMVGLVEDVRRVVTQGFKREGHFIALVGETGADLAVSEYASVIEGRTFAEMARAGRLPRLDLERERAVQETTLRAAEEGLLQSAHDCAEGGLAVALAEGCFSSLGRDRIGVEINLDGDLAPTAHLFAETPSRIVVSFDETARPRLEQLAAEHACPLRVIGRTGGTRLLINHNGDELVSQDIHELETLWRASLGGNLQTEVLVAAAE
ncbi:MAG TPA: AIR synthase-related protein, partial [Pyrinomonadaceae bacterium]|nr:AIR synthase-related protein [Pyrinomonadaceae bacterium]